MPVQPTKRSIDLMRDRGYWCQRVETWNPFAKVRVDLCGCDVLALKEGQAPVLIQATTASHRNARVEKLNNTPSAKLWKATGGRILVHGWKPLTKSRRTHEVEEIEWGNDDDPMRT